MVTQLSPNTAKPKGHANANADEQFDFWRRAREGEDLGDDAGDLARAMRYEPEAVKSLVAAWPQLAREVKWLRRRIFMMSTQAYCAGAKPLWHGVAASTDVRNMVVAYI